MIKHMILTYQLPRNVLFPSVLRLKIYHVRNFTIILVYICIRTYVCVYVLANSIPYPTDFVLILHAFSFQVDRKNPFVLSIRIQQLKHLEK